MLVMDNELIRDSIINRPSIELSSTDNSIIRDNFIDSLSGTPIQLDFSDNNRVNANVIIAERTAIRFFESSGQAIGNEIRLTNPDGPLNTCATVICVRSIPGIFVGRSNVDIINNTVIQIP